MEGEGEGGERELEKLAIERESGRHTLRRRQGHYIMIQPSTPSPKGCVSSLAQWIATLCQNQYTRVLQIGFKS